MPICSMYGWYIYLQNWVVLFGQTMVRIWDVSYITSQLYMDENWGFLGYPHFQETSISIGCIIDEFCTTGRTFSRRWAGRRGVSVQRPGALARGRRAWAMGISGPWVGTGLENVINHELSQLQNIIYIFIYTLYKYIYIQL